MKPSIWYYKPWMINRSINYEALFDKNDKQIQTAQAVNVPHPLDEIQRFPIKSTMMEVSRD